MLNYFGIFYFGDFKPHYSNITYEYQLQLVKYQHLCPLISQFIAREISKK